MPSLTFRSPIPAPVEALGEYHYAPHALERLQPPWDKSEVVGHEGPPGSPVQDGSSVTLRVRQGPLRFTWRAVHEGVGPEGFDDIATKGPMRTWRHEHRFLADGQGSILEDRLDYAFPLGPLGSAVAGRSFRRCMERLFAFRHARTEADLARGTPPLDVVITGATGMIGTQLANAIQVAGGHVRRVTRSPDPGDIGWDAKAHIDAQALEGADAVVHLAGENIGESRWSEARKQRIMDSRRDGTHLLAGALAGLDEPPKVLVSQSATGFYGDTEAPCDEDAPPGDQFLSGVCQAWEAAADPARDAGIRVVHPRTAPVLTPRGGPLQRMLLPFKLGAGGPIGGGQQYLPWISEDDAISALLHCITTESLSGPVNVAAPQAVRQKEFAKTLARVLRRPAVAPLPAVAVKALFGEMGKEALLEGQQIVPRRLRESGFAWLHPDLGPALRHVLGRPAHTA